MFWNGDKNIYAQLLKSIVHSCQHNVMDFQAKKLPSNSIFIDTVCKWKNENIQDLLEVLCVIIIAIIQTPMMEILFLS